MLPYLPPPPPIRLFGLHLPIFGLFLFAAALAAYLLITIRGRRLGLGPRLPEQLAGTLLLAAILGAHLTGTLADNGAAVFSTPTLLFSLGSSLSSAGGFLGAVLAGLFWSRRLRLERHTALTLADLVAHAFPFAWLIARAGCAIVHDHPGRLSTSPFALPFPGGSRLDAGLLELLATPLLVVLALALSHANLRRSTGTSDDGKRQRAVPEAEGPPATSAARSSRAIPPPSSSPIPPLSTRPAGLLAGSMAVAYALVRFPLDFLRATDLPGSDTRYAGLTAAQWGALPLFAVGVWCVLFVANKAPRPRPPP